MKMRKIFLSSALLIFAIVAWVASAMALTLYIDRIEGYYYGSGGEFNISNTPFNNKYASQALVGYGFETFCVERYETISPSRYYEYYISYGAVKGGGGSVNDFDPISRGTALLYSLFSLGKLPDYDYSPGTAREQSAARLQNVIWYLEDEISVPPDPNENPFAKYLLDQNNSWYYWKENNDLPYNVAVLNLYKMVNGSKVELQSQLVYLPEPTTSIMLGIALLGFGVAAMRLRRKI